MKRFVFSADGHIREPQDLFTRNLPPSMHRLTLRAERQDDHILSLAGEKVLARLRVAPQQDISRGYVRGGEDLDARLQDMRSEGIDAEILFPSLGMMSFLLEDAEAEYAAAQAYNDYVDAFVGPRRDTFVRCAVLPLRDGFRYTVREMRRVAALGFTSAMIPAAPPRALPAYNDPAWDPVFEAAQELRLVFAIHAFTGREDVRMERGPGGAVINYAHQMVDAQMAAMYMVAGGLLDRFPGAKVAFIESGASWLAALAERMDEVYAAHSYYVAPKLSLRPSEIIRRQVSASFQRDRAAILSRAVTGHQALLWGADYPHHEGTYPDSRKIVDRMFDGVDIGEQERADIRGGNAARLFRLERPEFLGAA